VLRFVVLGLLVERPGYGYELQRRLGDRFAFLGVAETSVYRLLDALERSGEIEVRGPKPVGGTPRGAPRVTYEVTGAGHTVFSRWMASPCRLPVVRDELLVRLALATCRAVRPVGRHIAPTSSKSSPAQPRGRPRHLSVPKA
jgi:DNA-binding PadR family transcriptional regulator